MEYVYSAMLLHAAKKKIDEKSVTDVLKAAGIDVDSGRVKALVASLKDIDIEEAIKSASVMPAAQVQAAPAQAAKAEKKEEEGKTEEEAAAGLGALFG
ncbi:MAG: 50S ribosomal protein P1 [Candidatus Diapherotrites archaeon CG10_big_fil_rev_8_21_14_0_10_31_34]|nr:MAG: 50S ribosomal protein P1 [Candidatus Diapherotrites archaeon CG10_big_fil_rev_8_21_14_0_10_31_34]